MMIIVLFIYLFIGGMQQLCYLFILIKMLLKPLQWSPYVFVVHIFRKMIFKVASANSYGGSLLEKQLGGPWKVIWPSNLK